MTRDHAIRLLRPFGLEEVGPDRAFKRAAMKYHPDKGGSAVAFTRITEARELLLPEDGLHAQARGRAERFGFGGPVYGSSFSERVFEYNKIFEDLFRTRKINPKA